MLGRGVLIIGVFRGRTDISDHHFILIIIVVMSMSSLDKHERMIMYNLSYRVLCIIQGINTQLFYCTNMTVVIERPRLNPTICLRDIIIMLSGCMPDIISLRDTNSAWSLLLSDMCTVSPST